MDRLLDIESGYIGIIVDRVAQQQLIDRLNLNGTRAFSAFANFILYGIAFI